jgi:hypothetical protein
MAMASGGHSVKAFTGAADHCRQEVQWQYPIAAGLPTARNSTAPQKQRPLYSLSVGMVCSPWAGFVAASPQQQLWERAARQRMTARPAFMTGRPISRGAQAAVGRATGMPRR